MEESQKDEREDFLTNLKSGEIRSGVVSSVVNFGAFVDLGGMDGLIHVSELSWKHVDHPGSVVSVGDEIGVREKTSSRQLATRNLEGSQYHPAPPWVDVNADSLQGTVSRFPQADELEQSINVQLVVEFYSR